MIRGRFALGATAALGFSTSPARAALAAADRAALARYLDDLVHERYDGAYGALAADERRYFGSAANLRSIFVADSLRIERFRLLASRSNPHGVLVVVSERISYFDHATQQPVAATARVAYGVVADRGVPRVKDPYHPWRAFAPNGIAAAADGLDVVLRKISFFTGRLECVFAFTNTGERTISVLPYGRTTLRDERGRRYLAIESRAPGLTDRTLYGGLRLQPHARYTGAMTFATPDRFSPVALSLAVGPVLVDGADAPSEIALPTWTAPVI